MLYKSQKQKLDPKNITPHSTKRTGFTRSCRFSSFCKKKSPSRGAIIMPTKNHQLQIGGAAGYRLRVRKIFRYALYEHSLFFLSA